jgi:iron complex transport system permease protein
VNVLLHFSIAEEIHAYVTWTFGSFGGVTNDHLVVLAPAILLGLAVAFLSIKSLNALLMGEAYALSMGLSVRNARFWLLGGASVLTGAVTAFCGPIAFLGVAVPHLCRSLLGTSDHRPLLPAVTLMGALLALLADLIARMPGTTETTLPLNAVTSLIGAPVVIWVVLSQRNLRSSFAA